jgi:hypothetical protein
MIMDSLITGAKFHDHGKGGGWFPTQLSHG